MPCFSDLYNSTYGYMVFKYGMKTTTGQSKTLHRDGHSVCLAGMLYSPVTLHAVCQPPRRNLIPLTGPFRRVPKKSCSVI